jgi:hypothetical protein
MLQNNEKTAEVLKAENKKVLQIKNCNVFYSAWYLSFTNLPINVNIDIVSLTEGIL